MYSMAANAVGHLVVKKPAHQHSSILNKEFPIEILIFCSKKLYSELTYCVSCVLGGSDISVTVPR